MILLIVFPVLVVVIIVNTKSGKQFETKIEQGCQSCRYIDILVLLNNEKQIRLKFCVQQVH